MGDHVPAYLKLLSASVSGISGAVVMYPLDLIKFNMQLAGDLSTRLTAFTTWQFAKYIVNRDGVLGLYQGLSASVLRQTFYTGTRLGLLQIYLDQSSDESCRSIGTVPIQNLLWIGMWSGCLGAILGLPADVAMVRMAVDKNFRQELQRNYKNVFDALIRIYREEGFGALYTGIKPTLLRTVIMNTSQVFSYYETKKLLIKCDLLRDDIKSQLICSIISTWISAVCVLPPDMAKISDKPRKTSL